MKQREEGRYLCKKRNLHLEWAQYLHININKLYIIIQCIGRERERERRERLGCLARTQITKTRRWKGLKKGNSVA